MGRSEKMYARVRRNLKGMEQVTATEIYESLQLAQQDIILRFNGLTKDIEVTTVEDQVAYTLQDNIRSIKSIVKPTGDAWYRTTKYVMPKNWEEISRIEISGEPLYWMFNDNMTELKLHPAPTTDDEIITLQCYMKNSTTEIGDGVEPEIEDYWDTCMVYYATSEYLDPQYWLGRYENRVQEIKHVAQQSTLEAKVKKANW